jgi:O-succinylbenzoic acid--CoA ligase
MGLEPDRPLIHWPIFWQGRRISDLAELPSDHLAEIARRLASNEETFRVMTSGSTGEPRAIEISKRRAAASAQATAAALGLRPGDSILLAMHPEPIAGRMMIWRALHLGLDLWWTPPTSVVSLPANSPREFAMTAWAPRQLAETPTVVADRFRIILVGGAPLTPLAREAAQRTRAKVILTYGMTETISHVALGEVSAEDWLVPLPGVEIKASDDGALCVRGAQTGGEWVTTTDAFERAADGRFRILGRLDFVINSGGIKIHPEALERELQGQIEGRFAITSRPSSEWGQEVVLAVDQVVDLHHLVVKDPRTLPKAMAVITDWPETLTGKLDRRRLAEIAQASAVSPPNFRVRD